MNSLSGSAIRRQRSAAPAARLGASHGYLFNGDAVQLRATFADVTPAAHGGSWALQLWACAEAPADGAVPAGHLVAEAWLPSMAECVQADGGFEVVAAATPPAGTADWALALALVAIGDEGGDVVHDLAVYPRRESFILPRLEGGVSCRVAGERVHVDVETVTNPRDARNVSGTLALELWALREPYAGGQFAGVAQAGAVLGTLGGQEHWRGLAFDLEYTLPPIGTWHVVLMLREWVGRGYVTRDFRTLEVIVIAPPKATAAAPVTALAEPARVPAKKPGTRKAAARAASASPRGKKAPPKA